MKNFILLFVCCFLLQVCSAQKVIQLYAGKAPGSESWTWSEKEVFSTAWNTQIVYNVTQPTITAYLPDKTIATGVAVVIAPGGAFHALSINSEGIDVAKWLNQKGIAAFVLKYRLAHILTEDPAGELSAKMNEPQKLGEAMGPIIPLAIADGLLAMKYVRAHANEFGVDTKKIGIMGFSAGGTVTMGVSYKYDADSRPDFSAPIYAYIPGDMASSSIPSDAPALFICAATNDGLRLATHSSNLYNKWIGGGKQAELHMYAKGDHGFGMRKQNLPTDKWIERFYEWLEVQGFLQKAATR